MTADSDLIAKFVCNRNLVRIARTDVDTRILYGFPLALSDDLLVLLYVYDFHIDGLLFLRRDTVSDIQTNATARFQRQLLNDAGDINSADFSIPYSIDSFSSLLAGLPKNTITILEEESLGGSGFWIGRYAWSKDRTHCMHEFSGAGNWEDELTVLNLDAITCCQLDTNYIRYYQRYFDAHGFPKLPG